MRIALFNTFTPFVRGGAEVLVDDLKMQLEQRGHEVILFRIPFSNDYEMGLLDTVYASENLNFDAYDVVIAFKFPAYCAVHRRKVLWFFHQFRQVYDLYGKEYGLQDNELGRAIKQIITLIDTKEIGNSHKVFTNAEEVTKRLKQYNGLASEVLNPPLQEIERYHNKSTGDYIYYPSRITNLKRQALAIQAMAYVNSGVKLVINGKCDEPEYYDKLLSLIKKHKLSNKVEIRNEWVSDEKKIELISNSLALLYIPYKEDSCGFVTMEGFYASKPVISCTDSGGTIEFIEHKKTGLFCEPDPKELAKCMDELYKNKKQAELLGKQAREWIVKKNITWEETIRRLLCE